MAGDPVPYWPPRCGCPPQFYAPFRLDPDLDAKAIMALAEAINRLADALSGNAALSASASGSELAAGSEGVAEAPGGTQ